MSSTLSTTELPETHCHLLSKRLWNRHILIRCLFLTKQLRGSRSCFFHCFLQPIFWAESKTIQKMINKSPITAYTAIQAMSRVSSFVLGKSKDRAYDGHNIKSLKMECLWLLTATTCSINFQSKSKLDIWFHNWSDNVKGWYWFASNCEMHTTSMETSLEDSNRGMQGNFLAYHTQLENCTKFIMELTFPRRGGFTTCKHVAWIRFSQSLA